MKHALLLAACLALATPVAARAQGLDLSKGGPVDVTAAGGFEFVENEQKVIASGDARAVRGDVTVLADRLIAYYRKKAGAPAAPAPSPDTAAPAAADLDGGDNEVYRLEAEGHVRIYTPTDEAVGDRAIYDIDTAVLVMTGKAMKLTTPQQVMTARDSMEYWSQKHMAVGRGAAVVVTSDGRRLAGDVLVGYTDPPAASPAAGVQKAAATQPARVPPAASQPDAAAPGKPPADPIAASGKLQRLEAFGNVEVRTAVDIARGDRGVYVADSGMARLLGHVRITHGQDQLNGPAADVDMKTGIAHLVSQPGGRVSGLIVPNDTTKSPDTKAGGDAKAPADTKGGKP